MVAKKFGKKNIEMPFPHVIFYLGQDKKGEVARPHILMKGTENRGVSNATIDILVIKVIIVKRGGGLWTKGYL
jgi:hypothetical protein